MSEKSKYTESQWSRENKSRNRNPDGCNDCGFFYIFLLHCALLLYLKKVNNVIAVCSKYVQVHTFWLNRMCVQSRQIRNWLQNSFLQRLESIQPAIVRLFFFAQRFLFQIIISTQRLMKLYFIYILFAICSLNASSKSHYLFFFEWGWEFRIEPYKLREFSIFCSAKHRLMKVTIADLSKFKSHKVSVFRKRKKTHLQCFLLRLLLLFIFIILKIMHQLLHNISVESTKFNWIIWITG